MTQKLQHKILNIILVYLPVLLKSHILNVLVLIVNIWNKLTSLI